MRVFNLLTVGEENVQTFVEDAQMKIQEKYRVAWDKGMGTAKKALMKQDSENDTSTNNCSLK